MSSATPNPHEKFEELCTLAAGGFLSVAEQRELTEHLHDCESCLAFYEDMQELHGSLQTDAEAIFAARPSADNAPIVLTPQRPAQPWMQMAAALLIGAGLATAATLWLHRPAPAVAVQAPAQQPVATPAAAQLAEASNRPASAPSAALTSAREHIAQLEAQLAAIKHSTAKAVASPQPDQTAQDQTAQLNALKQQEAFLTAALNNEQQKINALNAQVTALQQAHQVDTEQIQSRENRLRLLNTELEAPQPARSGNEKSPSALAELMGQRNLHVIDVYDENSHGQRNAPFGRVFFGENSSLVFYAFDLPVKESAGQLAIVAWGQTEGSERTPIRLGDFNRNDSNGSRWLLSVKDPNQLKRIDAVFVTIEHKAGKKPSGPPLLYAYLRQAPNHP